MTSIDYATDYSTITIKLAGWSLGARPSPGLRLSVSEQHVPVYAANAADDNLWWRQRPPRRWMTCAARKAVNEAERRGLDAFVVHSFLTGVFYRRVFSTTYMGCNPRRFRRALAQARAFLASVDAEAVAAAQSLGGGIVAVRLLEEAFHDRNGGPVQERPLACNIQT